MWEFDTGENDLPFGLAAIKNSQLVPKLVQEMGSPVVSSKLKRLVLRMLHPGNIVVSEKNQEKQ